MHMGDPRARNVASLGCHPTRHGRIAAPSEVIELGCPPLLAHTWPARLTRLGRYPKHSDACAQTSSNGDRYASRVLQTCNGRGPSGLPSRACTRRQHGGDSLCYRHRTTRLSTRPRGLVGLCILSVGTCWSAYHHTPVQVVKEKPARLRSQILQALPEISDHVACTPPRWSRHRPAW